VDPDTAAPTLERQSCSPLWLRAAWLQHPAAFTLQLSGGNHRTAWPAEVQQFLQSFLPLQRPPNYQLVADELATRFAFQRDRKSVAAYARDHFPLLVSVPSPPPKPRRRWERARVGELWQHDSYPPVVARHDKQTLLLTIDDHSRKLLAAIFVPTDTTWNNSSLPRPLTPWGCLGGLYTDGLACSPGGVGRDKDGGQELARVVIQL